MAAVPSAKPELEAAPPTEHWVEAAPSEPTPVQPVGGVRRFDDQPVFVGQVVAGPGLASWAKVGQTVFVVSPDGSRWRHRLNTVMHDGCEANAPLDSCAFIDFDASDDAKTFGDTVGAPPWTLTPTTPGPLDVEDIALRPVFLASVNAPAPEIVFERFRVDYRKALCEDGSDEEHRVLMTEVNSTTPDPLAKASALGKRRKLPRRTLSVDVGDDTLHFAFISTITMPSDRTMLSLDRDRTEWMWVAREHKGRFSVLVDERREVRRGMNHDFACQLPFAAPVPFALRHERQGLTVYTRAPGGIQRWRIQDGAMPLDATFDISLLGG
ncbi:MAG: hypothetical protein ACRBN8_14485 [Nannocystales bacterium]